MLHGGRFKNGWPNMAKGPVIFATQNCHDGVVDAKAYIRRFSLTAEDVALVVRGGQVLVIAKRDCSAKLVD